VIVCASLLPDGALELWAGPECTVNRVADQTIDQLELSGHSGRESDLDLLGWLGVRAARYPVLWERTAPAGLERAIWDWPDRRLARLRELHIRPIVGLLHHGSGPRDTSLLDPNFPEKLARYAGAVASRYPWVEDWTPINEPLTTARFSALYGLWYPHARSLRSFLRATLNQCRATQLAMAEIRAVVPNARLVQTEDFGRIAATPVLAKRARADQLLRFLSLDLLTGAVTVAHPLWRELLRAGATEDELWTIRYEALPPDIIGVNHYVTSDRFLDERLSRYPTGLHGGDGCQRFADVESVRVAEAGVTGHAPLLEALWVRYGRPLAITEVHLACTRDEQLRWFAEAWQGARDARREGVDVRAVTAWSLVGSFGWERLVTDSRGKYEPGVFDLRAQPPRATAVGNLVRSLAHGRPYDSPALDVPGWWRRPGRVLFPEPVEERAQLQGRPLLVTGAGGTLGQAFARAAARRGLRAVLLTRRDLDIADRAAVEALMEEVQPWAVVNAAGYVRVDDAEEEAELCWRENVTGAVTVARAVAAHGCRLATFSTDLVFDGRSAEPYDEDAVPGPLNVYGRSKAVAEELVLAAAPQALVVRTAAFFGPWDQANFVAAAVRSVANGATFAAAADLRVSPTYVPDLADAVLDLLLDDARGIWHATNQSALSWSDLAYLAVAKAGLEWAAHLIHPMPAAQLNFKASRPANSALTSVRGQTLGSLDDALARYAVHGGLTCTEKVGSRRAG
jgi:dTDP-4-dehydrorhamnose reductase